MRTKIVGFLSLSLAVAALTACGDTGDADTASAPPATETADFPGNSGSVLSDDEDAVTAVESALSAQGAKVSWNGDTLRVEMQGSATSPTAFLYCSVLDLALTDGQSGVFVFPDGTVDCEDDPRKAD